MMLHRTMKSYNQHHHQHRAKFRSGSHNHHQQHHHQSSTANNINSRKPYIQAHINFFDNNGDDGGAGALKLNKYQTDSLNQRQNKWPNLSRLQSKLKEDITDGELPPYIKKYNRRNKQLINLLEGTISPNYSEYHKKISQQRRQKNTNKWLEKYLFEEQRPIKSSNQQQQEQQPKNQEYVLGKHTQVEPNALPGEYVTVAADLEEEDDSNNNSNDKNNNNANDIRNNVNDDENAVSNAKSNNGNDRIDSKSNMSTKNNSNYNKMHAERPSNDKASVRKPFDERHSNQTKISNHKRDQFLFHRVAAPKLVGMGAMEYGARKQRLPFVAITDKRVGEVKQRFDNMQAAAANLPPSP